MMNIWSNTLNYPKFTRVKENKKKIMSRKKKEKKVNNVTNIYRERKKEI